MTAHGTVGQPQRAFKSPGAANWRSLDASGKDGDQNKQDEARSSLEELKNALLASLQMQHLVVLAGSGCSLSAGGPSMADLWKYAVGEPPTKAAREVAERVKQDLEDTNIEAFLSRIEAFLQVDEDAGVRGFLNASRRVILEKCSGFAEARHLRAHETCLHRLSRRRVRDPRLKVFTTNYDLCFEHAAADLGGVALDGFSFAAPRRYDPRFFGYDIVRRPQGGDDLGHYLEGVFLLYKLHGSVNWARAEGGAVVEKERPEPEEACLIYPARAKYQQSFTQPHLESMAQYLAAVREPNTCMLVLGFGFNDDHLAEPLLSAARSNPHLRLIIVDPEAQTKCETGNEYWVQLESLSDLGEDIWFVAASFEDFAEMTPDLKSLAPADVLMRAIQGVSREQ
ncbi:MAG: SIR2 family protein [Thermoleophilia bacterium]